VFDVDHREAGGMEVCMARVFRGRHMAEIDGDFVVFLIGARLDFRHPARTVKDLGGRRGGMKAMLDHLVVHPDKGLLGYTMGYPVIVQYWRSFEHLEAFARDESDPHALSWRNYWSRLAASQGTGIWHETYLIRAGDYETIYANMPAFGLGAATRLVPAAQASTARLRIRRRAG
jgi:hypothetical protein